MLSQPLLSFPSAVPLGGEGLSGGLPPPPSAITKRKGRSHMRPGHRALRAAPGGPQRGKGGRTEGAPHPARAAASRNCKSPVRRGGRRTRSPRTPKCCMNTF